MPMYLPLAGNDTVPTSVWRGGRMRRTKCRAVCFGKTFTDLATTTELKRLMTTNKRRRRLTD